MFDAAVQIFYEFEMFEYSELIFLYFQ